MAGATARTSQMSWRVPGLTDVDTFQMSCLVPGPIGALTFQMSCFVWATRVLTFQMS